MSEKSSSENTKPSLLDDLWQGVFAFEANQLSAQEVQQWFILLVSSGYIWKLPTQYLNQAANMMEHGYLETKQRGLDS